MIKEAYERLKYDIKASHILVRLDKDPSPADTLKAYEKIVSIRNRCVNGSDFGKLANFESDDPSAKQNKGDLGYFSAFRMVYPFESAAFSTNVGEISKPIRTSFGYHILKVEDKREAFGEVKAAHIMISIKPDASEEEKAKAKQKIVEINEKLKGGDDFKELARKFSDDRGSARRGGELPWFGSGRMVAEFEKEAFALKNNNDVSQPFETQFGWHIVKRLDKKELKSFEEEKDQIKKKVERDGRSKNSKASLVSKLKIAYKVKEYTKAKDAYLSVLDTNLFVAKWDANKAKDLTAKLFIINDKQYGKKKTVVTQKEFTDYIKRTQRAQEVVDLSAKLNSLYDEFFVDQILAYEESILAVKYPEYKALVQEYRDGILLFELMEKKVWKKAVQDSAGLADYHNAHRNDFMWTQRLDAKLYTCNSDEIAKEVVKLLESGAEDSTVLAQMNKESQLAVDIREDKFSKGDHAVVDGIQWKKGISKVVNENGSYYVVMVNEVLSRQPKELKEARGAITSAYQGFLEENWIKELREKYSYDVNKDAIKMVNK